MASLMYTYINNVAVGTKVVLNRIIQDLDLSYLDPDPLLIKTMQKMWQLWWLRYGLCFTRVAFRDVYGESHSFY